MSIVSCSVFRARSSVVKEVLTFQPPRRCIDCQRMTRTAILTDEWNPGFNPVCPWHGFMEASAWKRPTRAEVRAERESIARFVVAIHQGIGTARVIRRVKAGKVPGWEPPEEIDPIWYVPDAAWYVCHHRAGKKRRRKYGYVTYSYGRMEFEWYPERKRHQPERLDP